MAPILFCELVIRGQPGEPVTVASGLLQLSSRARDHTMVRTASDLCMCVLAPKSYTQQNGKKVKVVGGDSPEVGPVPSAELPWGFCCNHRHQGCNEPLMYLKSCRDSLATEGSHAQGRMQVLQWSSNDWLRIKWAASPIMQG